MKHNRLIVITSVVSMVALVLLLTTTSPTEIGPFGVLLFFTTLYISIFGLFSLVLQLFNTLAFRRSIMRGKDYLYTAVLAFGPIMVMMAHSFGAANVWTLILIGVFLFLAEFLVAKRV